MSRRGFTLIELLVVIAIIAILAAILFPVFAKAREKARTASCQSNLKQIATALVMYRNDYDETNVDYGRGPYGTPTDDWINNQPTMGPSGRYSWGLQIMPYVKNVQVFVCPSGVPSLTRPNGSCGHNPLRWMSYGCNLALVHQLGGRWMGNRDSNITNANCIVVSDACGRHYTCVGHTANGCTATAGWEPLDVNFGVQPGQGGQSARHNDGCNHAYYDGHVKWQRITRVGDYAPRIP